MQKDDARGRVAGQKSASPGHVLGRRSGVLDARNALRFSCRQGSFS